MPEPLWTWTELAAAANGRPEGAPAWPIRGVSIDSRSLRPGDLFVALSDQRDGHAFVPAAFRAGAVAAIVANDYRPSGSFPALLRVDDPLQGLINLARAARLRSAARIIAITGSVGKTGTKEMLSLCLSELARTTAAEKSYNDRMGLQQHFDRL